MVKTLALFLGCSMLISTACNQQAQDLQGEEAEIAQQGAALSYVPSTYAGRGHHEQGRQGSHGHGEHNRTGKPLNVQLGPRPYFLVDDMDPGELKDELMACSEDSVKSSDFSIGHRGAGLQFPEHSKESYLAAARMGAGIIECDVTFTKDRELVCRHSQCDLHATTNILATDLADKCTQPFVPADPEAGTPASAKCCTSDITLAEFKSLCAKMDASNPQATTVEEYMGGTPDFRTDLYATCGTPMSHAESIQLIKGVGAKFTPELKTPSVEMPYEGDYTQEDFAQQMVDEYKAAHIAPSKVFTQSFLLDDILYLVAEEPAFAKNAVFLDGRYGDPAFDYRDPNTYSPTMDELEAMGVNIIAPPLWMLLDLDGANQIVPSIYTEQAKAAGLDIITWTLERDGPLVNGGAWYHQSIAGAINNDGDTYTVLDVLGRDVGVLGIFSDWPATVTYYANCVGL